MGAKLKSYYEQVRLLGGTKAEMRLTLLSKMSLIKASDEPDSAENIAIFESALSEIKKEFKS